MPDWLILADDLTGANDTGVCFTQRGLTTISAVSPGQIPPADVWVVSTNSRYLPPLEAAEAIRDTLRRTVLFSLNLSSSSIKVYKKMVSTLRGNPAVELQALLIELGFQKALIAPALPAQERSVINAHAYWKDKPLEQTEYGSQIGTGDIAELFHPLLPQFPIHKIGLDRVRTGTDAIRSEIEQQGERGVWVADAVTMGDLESLAEAAQAAGIQVLCGSAGLADAVAHRMALVDHQPAQPFEGQNSYNHSSSILAIVGSHNQTAAEQVEYAQANGIQSIQPPVEYLLGGNEEILLDWLEGIEPLQGENMICATATLPALACPASLLAERLAIVTRRIMRQAEPGGLFLVGGETAAAVCNVLHARLVRLAGEVMPGAVWGQFIDGDYPGMPLVTRAGGFGNPGSLMQAMKTLQARLLLHRTG